jgi:hypothetical protein
MRFVALSLMIALWIPCGWLSAQPLESPEAFEGRLDGLPVVDEIDTALFAPVHEFPPAASCVTNLLDQLARALPPREVPSGMAWVIGKQRGLKAGAAYVLSVEFPDDRPRTLFIANRGADLVRGFATGTATGDVRQQYTQPSLESLNYPQTGRWQRYRTVFVLHHRFQGLRSQRDPKPGGRPFGPEDGFHVIIFQSRSINDPRSEGAAVGKIRLHLVPDPGWLEIPGTSLPAKLPHRRLFFREEMGDEPVSARAAVDRGCPDPVDWYVSKARLARMLGFNTFAKDLLEFGHNQGWRSGDEDWVVNAQPPLIDLWDRLVPRLAAEHMALLPYYEYKGALGLSSARPPSLGWQRRAEKLYHGKPNTNYTGTWWVEQHNADITDPETLSDAKKVLDTTAVRYKGTATFAGAWFRTRGNHLPISFADAALTRFRASFAGDASVSSATNRDALISSYEGDGVLYRRYVRWWLDERFKFLSQVQTHLASSLGDPDASVIFTPWPGEPVPLLRDPQSGAKGHPVQLTTDDPVWWNAFAKRQPDSSWFRWALSPTSFDSVTTGDVYRHSLRFEEAVSPLPSREEHEHAAPLADPERYRECDGVMLTYPIGRLFTVSNAGLMDSYRSRSGLTVVKHYTLNEDNPQDTGPNSPFGGEVGYTCVDVDRAGPLALLQEARAVALADPSHIGYLCGSGYSTGFPGWVRRFNAAFLSLPALPSTRITDGASDPDVVVREIKAGSSGTYYLVVNTSMHTRTGIELHLRSQGTWVDLLSKEVLAGAPDRVDLYTGEMRTFRVTDPAR